jgi:hypothetical protein
MLPANAFARGYVPTPQGLASPITWLEGVFGVESPADMLTDAQNTIYNVNLKLTDAAIKISQLLGQAQGYDSVTSADVQAKAQACMSEAAGLQSNLVTLQQHSQVITTQISTSPTDKPTAQAIKDAAAALSAQIPDLLNNIDQLSSHVNDLEKYAQSGPGAVQQFENAAIGSISTLTWLVGGGALVYLLAPTLLPRLVRGFAK